MDCSTLGSGIQDQRLLHLAGFAPGACRARRLGLCGTTTLGLGMLVAEPGSRVTSKQIVGAEALPQGEDTAHL